MRLDDFHGTCTRLWTGLDFGLLKSGPLFLFCHVEHGLIEFYLNYRR